MITVVEERQQKILENSEGQSLIEFLIILPIFIGIFLVMLKSNAAIQMSIVNQKYTRLTLLRLTFNHPWIVNRTVAGGAIKSAVDRPRYHRLIMGMGHEPITAADPQPLASTLNISRSTEVAAGHGQTKDTNNQQEPKERAYVRIRNTLTLCLPMSFDNRGRSYVANFNQDDALTEAYAPSGTSGSVGSFGDICGGSAEAPAGG